MSTRRTNLPPRSDKRTGLAHCFERGQRLATVEKNYDYAHALFAQCVSGDPSNLAYVEALLKNLREKFGAPKKKPLLVRGGSRALSKALQEKQWSNALAFGLELLAGHPWDVTTLRALAEASAALHHNEVELAYLKQALDADPANVEVNRHCAQSLGRMGQFDQAIACWHRVEKLSRSDEEAPRMICRLTEEKLRYPDGRPPAAPLSTKPAVEPAKAPAPPAVVTLTPRQRLECAIADSPQDLATYLQLADLLTQGEQYEAAEATLARALRSCGEEAELLQRLDHARLVLAEQKRTTAELVLTEEQAARREPRAVPWLEALLLMAFVGLVVQIYPPAGAIARRIVNIGDWPRSAWFGLNILVLVTLSALRFSADIRVLWNSLTTALNRPPGPSKRGHDARKM